MVLGKHTYIDAYISNLTSEIRIKLIRNSKWNEVRRDITYPIQILLGVASARIIIAIRNKTILLYVNR
jgi:hypothetical protein